MTQNSGCTAKLKALADETRWRIVQQLLREERIAVTDLAEKIRVPQPSVSKHLRILREAGIVASERIGTTVWCFIAPEILQSARSSGTTLDLGCCAFQLEGPDTQGPR
jgi:DNA-binding transcriptional ArsR family regulator